MAVAEDVVTWLRDHGLTVDSVEFDGVVRRVPGRKSRKKDGWYVGYGSPIRLCIAGDWSTGQRWEWRESGRLTSDEIKAVRSLQRDAAAKADQDRAERHLAARAKAMTILAAAAPATSHHYLSAKQISACGVLTDGKALLIPNQDVTGMVWGAQRIYSSSKKLWFSGQRVSGTYFQIGSVGAEAFICEGFATGASIHMATGAAVFCAFSRGNLKVTAIALSKAWPGVRWTVAGDNDHATEGNPGRRDAEAAAAAIDATWVVPEMAGAGTDFNDLMLLYGLEAVRTQLQGAQHPMGDVTDINEARRKRQGKDELSTAELHHAIVMAMIHRPSIPGWPLFPRRFHVMTDTTGVAVVLEEVESGIVQYRDDSAVIAAILHYCYEDLKAVPGADISHKSALACKNLWLGLVPPLPAPPEALLEKSAPGLAFRRLPFDAPAGWPGLEPPLFEEFLSRCNSPLELCSFIGSLFYPEADRQQYLYIYGHGLDGKGSLLRLLFSLMGPAAQSLQPKGRDDRFWNMKVYGKRLVMFPDCEDFRFFASPEFKALTGNDPLFFEPKGKPGFSAVPTCKIIAASNHKPNITSQKSDMRRLIYVEVKAAPESMLSADYELRLACESEAIVRTCKEIYLQKCPKHGPIPCDYADDVAIEAESDYIDVFHQYFSLDPARQVSGADVKALVARSGIRSNRDIKAMKECWERQLGVSAKHSKGGTVYKGLRKNYAPTVQDGDERDER